jgi:hypothetical protein
MATEPDYYVFTFQTDQRSFPWGWEIRRHSRPMGVKLGLAGINHKAQQSLRVRTRLSVS